MPAPYQRADIHPVPIMLSASPTLPGLAKVLYLSLAIAHFKGGFGNTSALRQLSSEEHYRGALFEIEVGTALVRTGTVYPSASRYSRSNRRAVYNCLCPITGAG